MVGIWRKRINVLLSKYNTDTSLNIFVCFRNSLYIYGLVCLLDFLSLKKSVQYQARVYSFVLEIARITRRLDHQSSEIYRIKDQQVDQGPVIVVGIFPLR